MSTFTIHTIKMFSMLVIAGSAMLGGMVTQAQAGDKKIYNAALCTPRVGSSLAGTIVKYKNGAIYNFSTKRSVNVYCPVTRDNTSNKNGLKAWGFVGGNVPGSQDRLECQMMSLFHAHAGLIGTQKEKWVALPIDGGARTVANIRKEPSESRKHESFYSMECVIPKGKVGKAAPFLASYYVDEN